jgi:hypothetical protein
VAASKAHHCANTNVGSNPAKKMKGYLIITTSEKSIQTYGNLDFVKKNRDNLNQLRRLTDFLNPNEYKGFGRQLLTSHPFYPTGQDGLIEDIEENDEWDNIKARKKLAELEYSESNDDFYFKELQDAERVFELLDSKTDFEIIEISDEQETTAKTLGFDIGTWSTSYSLIADTFIIPMWHPPDFNDCNDIVEIGRRLNKNNLFDNYADASAFLKVYLTKSWGEKEMTDGQFKIQKLSLV